MIRPIVFGKFCLLERISVGGMAEIYRAKLLNAPHFKRFMAIKRVLPSLVADHEFITMFIDEARISVELNHSNICQIFELGRLNDAHYMVMEYIPGHDLLSIQKYYRSQRKIMSVSQACFIIAQVAQGLDFAHRATDRMGQPLGIVHRDISPQNILVSYEGMVKLIDFGVAKAASKNSKTQAGVLKGKFGYMSPEQADAAQSIDHRSDLFGLGTVFWELLTGRRLFYDENDYVTLEKVRTCAVPPPSGYNHLVPPQVDAIVMKALQREAKDRFASGGQMAQELWSFIATGNPPYTQNHLQHWMCAAFADDLKGEWEKISVFEGLNTPQDVQRYNAEHNWGDEDPSTVDFEGNVVPALKSSDGSKPEVTQVFTPQFDYSKIKGDASDMMPKQGDAPGGLNNPMHQSQFEMAAFGGGGKPAGKAGLIALAVVMLLAVAGLVVAFVWILGEDSGGEASGGNTAQGGGADATGPATSGQAQATAGSIVVEVRVASGDPEVKLYAGSEVVSQGGGSRVVFADLKPGTYRVEVNHPVFETVEVTQAVKGEAVTVPVELKGRKAQVVRMTVTPPGAQVWVDGDLAAKDAAAAAAGIKLAGGKTYQVEVRAPGHRTAKLQVNTGDAATSPPPVALEPGVGTLSVKVSKRADVVLTALRSGEVLTFEKTEEVMIPNLDATQPYKLEVKRSGYVTWAEEVGGFDEARGFTEARVIELQRD